jgi:hypothetical protein
MATVLYLIFNKLVNISRNVTVETHNFRSKFIHHYFCISQYKYQNCTLFKLYLNHVERTKKFNLAD